MTPHLESFLDLLREGKHQLLLLHYEYIMDDYLDLLFDKQNMYINNYKIINEKLFEKTETEQNDTHIYETDSPVIVQKLIYR